MSEGTATRFVRELRSFYALSIINLAFGAVAMAISVSFGVQNVLAIVDARNLLLPQLVFCILGFLAFGLSLRWLLTSAEILDGVQDIKEEYEGKGASLGSDDVTGFIIKAMAYYREKRTTVLKLVTASKVAGICFIVNGAVMLFTGVFSASGALDLLSSVGILLNLGVGFSGVYIPIYFERYVSTWGNRLQESVRAEKDLAKLMEGS